MEFYPILAYNDAFYTAITPWYIRFYTCIKYFIKYFVKYLNISYISPEIESINEKR